MEGTTRYMYFSWSLAMYKLILSRKKKNTALSKFS